MAKNVVPEAKEALNRFKMNFTRKNRTVKGYERQITYGFRVVV